MKCSNCGTLYDDAANFCPMCGEARVIVVETVAEPVEPQQPAESQQPFDQPPVQQPYYQQPMQPPQPEQPQQTYYQQPQQQQQTNYQQPGQQQYYQQPVQPQQQYYQQQPVPVQSPTKGKATQVLVFGILALAIPYAGIVLGILAVIFGMKLRGTVPDSEKGMVNAGFIMGIIGLVLWSIILIVAIAVAVTAVSSYSYYNYLF